MIKNYVMAVANKGSLTLYDDTGKPVTVSAKTHDIASLLSLISPFLLVGETVKLDLDEHLAEDLVINCIPAFEGITFTPVGENGLTMTNEEGIEIESAEKLLAYFKDAYIHPENEKGVKALLDRLFVIAKEREHSVKDVLKFLQENNFPLTAKGDIIAVKVLKQHEDTFVDHHSGNVEQNVGSIVHVPFDYVDQDRYQTCSKGLHIASLEYASSFWNNVSNLFLVAVKPEDIIAVPIDTATKVRVMSYFILSKLPVVDKAKITSLFSLEECQPLIKEAIEGNWPIAVMDTLITGDRGTGIINKLLNKKMVDVNQAVSSKEIDKTSPKDKSLAREKEGKVLTNKIRARQLYDAYIKTDNESYLVSLKALKARAKQSWEKLGIPELEKSK